MDEQETARRGKTTVRKVTAICLAGWLSVPAFGADTSDIVVEVRADGSVAGTIFVPAPYPEVHTYLEDPERTARLTGDTFEITIQRDGSCNDVRRKTRGLFSPLHLHTKRCPTAQGFDEQLAGTSEDFHAYRAQWELAEGRMGTEVTYTVTTDVNLPLPKSFVRSNVITGVKQALQNLAMLFQPKKKRKSRD